MLTTALLVAVQGLGSPASGSEADPPLSVPESAFRQAFLCSGPLSEGAGEPVLLVHGTGADFDSNFGSSYARFLPGVGLEYCAVNLPDMALSDIQVSAEYVVWALRAMSEASGRKVDMLGYSQGGLEARWALKWWPDTREIVDDLVMLGTPHHGVGVGLGPPALIQMTPGSSFLRALNSGDKTPDEASHTNIWGWQDASVPGPGGLSTAHLDGATNLAVHDLCPGRHVSHSGLVDDPVVRAIVLDALTHPGPADSGRLDETVCIPDPAAAQELLPSVGQAVVGTLGLVNLTLDALIDAAPQEPPLAPYASVLPG